MPDLSDFWPMLAAFLGAIAGGFGAPIPEEAVVIGAGIWVGSYPEIGPLRWLILPVCIIGILIADIVLYSIGRFWGGKILRSRWASRLLPADKRERIEDNFHHYGVKILLFVRWLPGIRSPMFITAGMMRLPVGRFIMADGTAAVVGHTALFFLAWWFGDQVQELVVEAEDRLKPILVLTGIGVLAFLFIYHFVRRPLATGDPEAVPIIGRQVAEKLDHASKVLKDGKLFSVEEMARDCEESEGREGST